MTKHPTGKLIFTSMLYGRIDELDQMATPADFREYVKSYLDGDPANAAELADILKLPLFNPVPLMPAGVYVVHGLEGNNSTSEPEFEVVIGQGPTTPFTLMALAWLLTLHTVWPDVNHTWFDYVEVHTSPNTISFSIS